MKKWKIALLIVIAIVMLQLPVIGPVLRAANTLVHESGHALAALLTNGQVSHIHLFANTEGVTMASSTTWWGQWITGLSGYIFASAFACLLAWMWHKNRSGAAIFLLLLLSAANLLFWVRNVYGIVWVSGFALFLLWLLFTRSAAWRDSASYVLFVIMVIDSIRSAGTIFLLSLWSPEQAGDAALMAQFSQVPAAVWGILFFAQSIFFGAIAAVRLLSTRRTALHSKSKAVQTS